MRALRVAMLLVIGVTGGSLVFWATAFIGIAQEQDGCAFGSLTHQRYRDLAERAHAQAWTLWPGLSNGIFWPSDRGLKPPSPTFEVEIGRELLRRISQLIPEQVSPDEQLAAAHALMRSIRAEFNGVSSVRDVAQGADPNTRSVYFNYVLAQRPPRAPVPALHRLAEHDAGYRVPT